jgi:hypothetical protein
MEKKSRKEPQNKCISCKAVCCHNLSIPVTRPRTRTEKEELKWYLHFDTVQIYIRKQRWHLLIKGKCIYLKKNTLCAVYESRPQVCRDHSPENCEMTGSWYDELFSTPDELDAYLNRKKKR